MAILKALHPFSRPKCGYGGAGAELPAAKRPLPTQELTFPPSPLL